MNKDEVKLDVDNEAVPLKVKSKTKLTFDPGLVNRIAGSASVVVSYVGPKGCGKTTACKFLQNSYGGTILTFADELKNICKEAFELSEEQVRGDAKDKPLDRIVTFQQRHFGRIIKLMHAKLHEVNPDHEFNCMRVAVNKFAQYMNKELKTPREIMQYVGTEIMHNIYLPFHCEMVNAKIDGPGLYFLDDLRFFNEWEYVDKVAPLLDVIEIKGRKEKKKGKEGHVSESDWKRITPDHSVSNSKSLDEYHQEVLKSFHRVMNDIKVEMATQRGVNYIKKLDKGASENKFGKKETVRVGRFGFQAR